MMKDKMRPFMKKGEERDILPFEKIKEQKEQRMRERMARMERVRRAVELRKYAHKLLHRFIKCWGCCMFEFQGEGCLVCLQAPWNCRTWTSGAWAYPPVAGAWRAGEPSPGAPETGDGEAKTGTGALGKGEAWEGENSYRAGTAWNVYQTNFLCYSCHLAWLEMVVTDVAVY